MPIEVKELVVKAIVSEDKATTADVAEEALTDMTEKMITECVDQVLKILERERER